MRDRTPPPSDRAGRLQAVATWLALVLILARPAYPSEDAATGSGLLIVSLWLVAALLWAAAQVARGELRLHAAALDALPILLAAATIASSAFAVSPRPAINMASEWAGLVLSYLLVRQLFRAPVAQRALLLTMLAGSFALSAYGIYQVFWGIELDRAEFARNRLEVLRELGIPPDSPREELFRNRLNSHEPFATFALANSLAGFLVAWLPIGIAMLMHTAWFATARSATNSDRASETKGKRTRRGSLRALVLGSAALATIVLCLVLTQSRTAYAALGVQLAWLATVWWRRGSTVGWWSGSKLRVAAAVAAACAVLIGMAVFSAVRRGKLDEKLFTQAARSLEFRSQYWQATMRLIADHPWIGVGPGNFRLHYLRYKLPESSEEIADPHNMVLEVAATTGWLGAGVLVATLIGAWMYMLRAGGGGSTERAAAGGGLLWTAGPGGLLLAAIMQPGTLERYVMLIAAWGIGAAMLARASRRLPGPELLACATAGLSLHLLGAGGIGMPGVAQSLWVLLALGLNRAESDRAATVVRSPVVARGVVAVVLGGLVWFGAWVLRPVSLSHAAFVAGRQALIAGDLSAAEAYVKRATEADPSAPEPWIELSRIHYEHWRRTRGREAQERFGRAVAAAETAARLAPADLASHARLAELFEARAQGDSKYWDRATDAFRRCVLLYPTSASLRARLARSLWHAGEHAAARSEMDIALELDRTTPHADKKLAPEDRAWLELRRGTEPDAEPPRVP